MDAHISWALLSLKDNLQVSTERATRAFDQFITIQSQFSRLMSVILIFVKFHFFPSPSCGKVNPFYMGANCRLLYSKYMQFSIKLYGCCWFFFSFRKKIYRIIEPIGRSRCMHVSKAHKRRENRREQFYGIIMKNWCFISSQFVRWFVV